MKLLSRITLLILFLGVLSAEAALQCRVALLTPTQEQVETTLDGLARMKMEVDLAKTSSIPQASLAVKKYLKKQAEVMQALNIDLPALRSQLEPRIRELQMESLKENNKKEQEKALVQDSLPTDPRFAFKSLIPEAPPMVNGIVAYLPQQNRVLYRPYAGFDLFNKIFALDLTTMTSTPFVPPHVAATMSPDNQLLYSVTRTGVLQIYSTSTLKKISSVRLGNNLRFSPNVRPQTSLYVYGDNLLLHDGISRKVYFYKISTGKLEWQLPSTPNAQFKFLNDKEFFSFDGKTVGKYNLSTGDQLIKETDYQKDNRSAVLLHLHLSRDSQELVIVREQEIRTLKTDNLDEISRDSFKKLNMNITYFSEVPGEQGAVFLKSLNDDTSYSVGVFPFATAEQSFELQISPEVRINIINKMTFSADGKKAISVQANPFPDKDSLVTWERMPR
jgi:hypothetical protein